MRRIFMLTMLLLSCSAVAHADPVTVTITNPQQNLTAFSGTVTFFGIIANTTSSTYNLGTPGHPFPGEREPFTYELSLDPTNATCINCSISRIFSPGCPNASCIDNPNIPLSLAGMSSTGNVPLFSLEFSNFSATSPITGTYFIHYYLAGTSGPVFTTSARFSIEVQNAPEPATFLLLGTGLLTGLAARAYKRTKL